MKFALSLSFLKTKFGPLFFSGDIEQGLRMAKTLGFDGVELSVKNPDELNLDPVIRSIKEKGLKVTTIATGQSYVDDGLCICTTDETVRKKTVERLKKIIDFAAKVEANVIIGGLRGKINGVTVDNYREVFAEPVIQCCEHASKAGVGIVLEPVNHYEVSCLFTLEETVKFIKAINHPALSVLYDSYHANMEEKSFSGPLLAAQNYLSHVHFADNNRLVPGYGHIDFREIISTLQNMNYQGYVCIEALPKPDSLTAAKQGINFLKTLDDSINNCPRLY